MAATKSKIHKGDGFTAQVEGEELVLRVDLTNPGSRSASGKTMVIASTRGAGSFDGTDVSVNLNVYRK